MAEEASSTAPLNGTSAGIGGLDGAKDEPRNPPTQPESLSTSKQFTTNLKSNQDKPSSDSTDGAANLTSPTSTQHPLTSGATPGPVPLDSTLRTTPIHPSLTSVKVPATAVAGSTEPNTNPITLKPFTDAELSKYGFEKLRAQISAKSSAAEAGTATGASATVGAGSKANEEEINRLREETAALLKHKLEERDAKIREIEREMEEKEKIREVERKVFRKKLGNAAGMTAATATAGAGAGTGDS